MTGSTDSILVVDDDDINRSLLLRLLEEQNYRDVEVASNGRQAIEKIHQRRFDAILLDIQMPEVDGYAVLEYLQSDMRLRDIPVIMISGVDELSSVVKCIEMGASDYLHKPTEPLLLRARLGASLDKKRLRDRQFQHLRQLRAEKKRSDALLNVILPATVAAELKTLGRVPPRRYENAALLFCDIVGFTAYCNENSPEDIVNSLQALFEKFEEITIKHNMEKIKTIGDEFMSAAGLTQPNDEPLLSAVACGLEMIEAVRLLGQDWRVRVGVNQGPVVAGIVGHDKYQFDVWGDTVNLAARLAQGDKENVVVLPVDAWLSIQDQCEAQSLGLVNVKGKGQIEVVQVRCLETSAMPTENRTELAIRKSAS